MSDNTDSGFFYGCLVITAVVSGAMSFYFMGKQDGKQEANRECLEAARLEKLRNMTQEQKDKLELQSLYDRFARSEGYEASTRANLKEQIDFMEKKLEVSRSS